MIVVVNLEDFHFFLFFLCDLKNTEGRKPLGCGPGSLGAWAGPRRGVEETVTIGKIWMKSHLDRRIQISRGVRS